MTDDEKRQQKAMLLLEFHEAEQNLAHLKEKASRIAMRIIAVADWVKQATEHAGAPDSVNTRMGYVNIIDDDQFAEAMDFTRASKLVQEIREAYSHLSDLTKRKAALGLS